MAQVRDRKNVCLPNVVLASVRPCVTVGPSAARSSPPYTPGILEGGLGDLSPPQPKSTVTPGTSPGLRGQGAGVTAGRCPCCHLSALQGRTPQGGRQNQDTWVRVQAQDTWVCVGAQDTWVCVRVLGCFLNVGGGRTDPPGTPAKKHVPKPSGQTTLEEPNPPHAPAHRTSLGGTSCLVLWPKP